MGSIFFPDNDYVRQVDQLGLLKSKKKTGGNHAFFRDNYRIYSTISRAIFTQIKTEVN